MHLKTGIIPERQHFIGIQDQLDYKAICIFAATGFFLDDDTYYVGQKVLQPATNYELSEDGKTIMHQENYFKWHYQPVERSLSQVVEEFAHLFETIVEEQTRNKKVILPLSGGLDSRTQAAALHHLKREVNSYSYSLEDGHPEALYSKQIAQVCQFPFQEMIIPRGYLWKNLENIAQINQCYTEFTHPRQVAVLEEIATLGDVLHLGHWGDVLFDGVKVAEDLPFEQQVEVVFQKILKKRGVDLAEALWNQWNIEGDFVDYLKSRIASLLRRIDIPDSANARIRAFKSQFWAPRWTSVNLAFFESVRPLALPYYDARMCAFICAVPERHLQGRQIQIEYLKLRNPELAKITWQDHRPFHLYNYHLNKFPYNVPFRVYQKIRNEVFTPRLVRNNYENQFLGLENDLHLQQWLFKNESFKGLIEPQIVRSFYEPFVQGAHLANSHTVSTLLTLSTFSSQDSFLKG
jgi:hypothetical protein